MIALELANVSLAIITGCVCVLGVLGTVFAISEFVRYWKKR